LIKEWFPSQLTKSGIMVGLGESREEVLAVMSDLRAAGAEIMTIGQYLQPTPSHLPVSEYVSLETFDYYRTVGLAMGWREVASGPLVRSSYQAEQGWRAAQGE